ncbi:MAG: transglutaminase-like domain-containing protein [Thermodesulfobacteriota bacterium]
MNRYAIAGLALIIGAIVALWMVLVDPFGIKTGDSHYVHPRMVRYGFTVTNTTNQLIRNAELLVRAPVKRTAHQICSQLTVSAQFQTLEDQLGNQVLRLILTEMPPFGTRIITVTADLMMADAPGRISLDDEAVWLAAEPFVEAADPDIRAEAKKLAAGNPMETAARINAWTADHIDYSGYTANERGAQYAYKNRKGDCTEYMDLFVALSRAAGIPARGIGGFICPESANLAPAGYHNWAEFHDGKTWKTADPQNRMFVEKARDYVVMRVISASREKTEMRFDRFRMTTEGLKVVMNDN